jgi:hypothetical protein
MSNKINTSKAIMIGSILGTGEGMERAVASEAEDGVGDDLDGKLITTRHQRRQSMSRA